MKKMLGGLVVAVAAVLAMGQVVQAADDYKPFGVRVRALYVVPDEDFDSKLSALDPKVESDLTPELDLEYFISKNFSAELILGVTHHDIKLKGDYEGSAWLLPPTLTVKYHPFAGSTFSPYIGAGVNYVIPFDEDLNGVDDFSIDESFGWAAQAGVDMKVTENLFINLDYKYLNVETKAKIGGEKYDLDLNPSVYGIGVGYRF
ncbi:MAG: OmpW family protein [Geobacteraceae bacterium]|nr:OmpW family protein [Geobacteraceae bacterium]